MTSAVVSLDGVRVSRDPACDSQVKYLKFKEYAILNIPAYGIQHIKDPKFILQDT